MGRRRRCGDDGIDYVKLYLVGGETPKIADVFAFDNAELLSTTLRRLLAVSFGQVAAAVDGDDEVSDEDAALMDAMVQVVAANRAYSAGDYAAADRIFRGLPDSVRQRPFVLRSALFAAGGLDDDTRYRELLAEYERRFGDDPDSALILVDAHVLAERWDRALQAIATLDRQVGGDPALDAIAAGLLHETGDFRGAAGRIDAALTTYADSSKLDPITAENLMWLALSAASEIGDHEQTLAWLLRADPVVDGGILADLSGFPEYADFVASEPYLRWRDDAGRRDAAETDAMDKPR